MQRCISWICISYLLLLGISGCTTVTNEAPLVKRSWKQRETALTQLTAWQIKGKIGVQTADDSGSATVSWQQQQSHYTIMLLGPLGSNQLTLTGQPGNVTMDTAEGKHFAAKTPEELLMQQWHWQLPVSRLSFWVRGIPDPSTPYKAEFDANNRITLLKQQGWTIQYLAYQNSGDLDLPVKLTITSATIKSKIIIYQWNIHISH